MTRRDPLRLLVAAIALSSAANLAGTAIFVVVSSNAREANCERVEEAFDKYTQALAEISQAEPETVAEFRAAYEPQLRDCS